MLAVSVSTAGPGGWGGLFLPYLADEVLAPLVS